MTDHIVKPFKIELTAYYVTQEPTITPDEKPPLLLAIHGWGQNARRFMKDFSVLKKQNLLIVAPQGPHQFYLDTPNRKVGFNWITRYNKDDAVRDTNKYLAALLEHMRDECPYDEKRVYLLGFSQGVSMAWRFAVSGLVKPAGIIACCADLAPDAAEKLPDIAPFRVYLAHGKEDPLVPEEKITEAVEQLTANNFPLTQDKFDGGHELPGALLEKIGVWITGEG